MSQHILKMYLAIEMAQCSILTHYIPDKIKRYTNNLNLIKGLKSYNRLDYTLILFSIEYCNVYHKSFICAHRYFLIY